MPAQTALPGTASLANGSAPAAAPTPEWQISPVSNAPTTDATAPIRGNDQAVPSAKAWSASDAPATPNYAPAQHRHGTGTRRTPYQPPVPPQQLPPAAAGWGQQPPVPPAAPPPPFGGRTWDPARQTWWPAQPQYRPAHRRSNSNGWIILGALLVIGGIVFAIAMADQSSNNDGGYNPFPADTVAPYDPGVAYPTATAIDTPATTPAQLELTATGSLNQPRAFQTATLLRDGTVLIAGGTDGTKALSTAEIYDPAAGSFKKTGSMYTPRVHDTATLLNDGRVLIAGGEDGNGNALATAEIFDPHTGKFTLTGTMSTPRRNDAAAILPDGSVLVVGGDDGSATLASAETYDPATARFTFIGNMGTPREEMTATPLGGSQAGVVFVAGGTGPNGPLSSWESYDPTTGKFSGSGDMGSARQDQTAVELDNGNVLLVGGHGSDAAVDLPAYIYPADFPWTVNAALTDGRTSSAAAALPNGQALIAGGFSGSRQYVATVEIYDSATSTITASGTLAQGLAGLTATTLPGGAVLLVGGQDSPASTVPTAMLYGTPAAVVEPSTSPAAAANASDIYPVGQLNHARAYHTATLLGDGKVLIAGGEYEDKTLATAELYNPVTAKFTDTGLMQTARVYDTATLLADGRVLIAGGEDQTGSVTARAEIYDPKTGKFTVTGSMATAREGAVAVAMADGRVLIVGGQDNNGAVASAEVYNPKTGKFSPTGSMSTPRIAPAASLLGSAAGNRVLVAGGTERSGYPSETAEVYNPTTGTFSKPMGMGDTRKDAVACRLANGDVLLVAGITSNAAAISSGGIASSSLLYDAASGSWSAVPAPASGRDHAAVAQLQDGSILIAGGEDSVSVLQSVQVFQPDNVAGVRTVYLMEARTGLTATVLKDGSVLIAGGELDSAVNIAEIYGPTR